MKEIFEGNFAIARGAWEAGVKVDCAYPGTPSSEILNAIAARYREDIKSEWSPNETVALEVAIGASIAGARAPCLHEACGTKRCLRSVHDPCLHGCQRRAGHSSL